MADLAVWTFFFPLQLHARGKKLGPLPVPAGLSPLVLFSLLFFAPILFDSSRSRKANCCLTPCFPRFDSLPPNNKNSREKKPKPKPKMFFKRLAVVGVVALAAANAASARELTGDKHSGEAALALDSEAGKPVGVLKGMLKAEGTVMTEAKAKEEKLKQKKWKVKSIPPLKKVRPRESGKDGEEEIGLEVFED